MNNKYCMNCKSQHIQEIEITTRGSFSLIEKSNKVLINPPSSKIEKYVCLDCGCISFYAENIDFLKNK